MKRCPNCGREAVRTEDWSCQWCSYPLMSGSYKKIDKTFRELREERLPQQLFREEIETEIMLEAEPEPVSEPELVPGAEAEPVAEPEPEPAPEPKPKPRRKPVAKRKSTARSKTTTEAKSPKSTTKPKTAARTKSAPNIETETAPVPANIEITVDGLLSAYETEGEAADARFASQILKITGVINRIEVNDTLDIYYITLNSAEEGRLLQGVRCVFDKKYGPELNQLTTGQTVTAQGKYDGSIIDRSLRDCVLVG